MWCLIYRFILNPKCDLLFHSVTNLNWFLKNYTCWILKISLKIWTKENILFSFPYVLFKKGQSSSLFGGGQILSASKFCGKWVLIKGLNHSTIGWDLKECFYNSGYYTITSSHNNDLFQKLLSVVILIYVLLIFCTSLRNVGYYLS